MQKTMNRLIKQETLDRLFDLGQKHVSQSGRCYCCGSDVEIIIKKTSRGYGFKGGVLYEPKTGPFLMQCERCFKNIGFLDHHKDED